MINISRLRINGQENPVGISELREIGWKITSDRRGVTQKSCQFQIAEDENFETLLYDSGVVESSESAHVTGRVRQLALLSSSKYFVRVRIQAEDGEKSDWKEGSFVTALLDKSEWEAAFVSPETEEQWKESKGFSLRKVSFLKEKVRKAYVHITALGLYHFYLNGEKISKDEFAPGWTSYRHHLLYQTYEVTEYLREGENVAGALIGPGWFKGDMGSARTRNHYGKQVAFACQMEVEYESGEKERFVTDETWQWADSPVLFSEIYDGEIYDARKEIPGWNMPGSCQGDWKPVHRIDFPKEALTAQSGCKVRAITKLPAKESSPHRRARLW